MSEGFVRLVNQFHYSGDLVIVNAAKQSYGRRSETFSPKDESIIRFMMEHRHGTPFEAFVMQFHIRCTIREAREWFRHRWGSFNEYSTRFSKRIDDIWIPTGPAIRQGSSTQGGRPVPIPMEEAQRRALIEVEFLDAAADMDRHYQRILELSNCQELASYVYSMNQMTEFTWTVNVRALCNFLSLRMDGAALLELRKKAYLTYALVEPLAPFTFQMWTEYRQPDMVTDWSDDDPQIPEEWL